MPAAESIEHLISESEYLGHMLAEISEYLEEPVDMGIHLYEAGSMAEITRLMMHAKIIRGKSLYTFFHAEQACITFGYEADGSKGILLKALFEKIDKIHSDLRHNRENIKNLAMLYLREMDKYLFPDIMDFLATMRYNYTHAATLEKMRCHAERGREIDSLIIKWWMLNDAQASH